jgi:hypothetical protein
MDPQPPTVSFIDEGTSLVIDPVDPAWAVERIRSARDWQEVVTLLAVGAHHYLTGIQVYLIHNNDLVGYLQLNEWRLDRESAGGWRLSLDGHSAVAQVIHSGIIFIGTPPPSDLSIQFLRGGDQDGKRLVMVPVVVSRKPYCLLVGQPGAGRKRDELRAPMARLAIEAGLVLTRQVVRHRRPTSPGLKELGRSSRPAREDPAETRENLTTLLERLDDVDRAEEARRALRGLAGSGVVKLLVEGFPGRLRVEHTAPIEDLPAAPECGAVLDALVSLGPRVLTQIGPLLRHAESRTRFFATHLLSAFFSPEAAVLASRQTNDPDAAVQWVALRTLRLFREQEGWAGVREQLLEYLRRPDPKGRAEACRTVGNLRDPEALAPLMAALSDGEREVVEAARSALVTLTKQDFRHDLKRWEAWASENRWRERPQWLFDGLVHKVTAVRASASVELEELMGHCYDYDVHLPRKERERIRVRCQEWWNFQKWWAEAGIAEEPDAPAARRPSRKMLPAHEPDEQNCGPDGAGGGSNNCGPDGAGGE